MENKLHMYAARTENQADILDLLSDISHEAAIASYITQDVFEDYFERLDTATQENRAFICYDFDRNKVKMGGVYNAIGTINKAIKRVNELVEAERARDDSGTMQLFRMIDGLNKQDKQHVADFVRGLIGGKGGEANEQH